MTTQPNTLSANNIFAADGPVGKAVNTGIDTVKQNKKLFVSVLLFTWLLSTTVTLIAYKPTYVSKGMLMIKDTAVTAKYITGDSYETTTSLSTSSVINTMGLLKADAYKHKLWDFFRTYHPEELKSRNIKNFKQWNAFFGNGSKLISYWNAPGTDLINVDFKWSNPQIATEGLQVVIDTFKELSLNLNQSEQRERGRFLGTQIEDMQHRLTAVREKIGNIKEANGIVDLAEENANIARARINLKTDMSATRAEASGKLSQLSGYQSMLGMSAKQAVTASALGRNDVFAKMQSELYALRSERNSLLTRYTEDSVKVQDVDNRIKQLEDNLEKEMKRTVGHGSGGRVPMAVSDSTRGDAVSRMMEAKAGALELGARSGALQRYLGELDTRAKKLNKVSVVLADLKLEEATLDESLKTLKEKELDAKLKETQTLSNVFVAEQPQIPLVPVAPTRTHFLIIDVLLAVIVAGLAIAAKEYLERRNMIPQRVYQQAAILNKSGSSISGQPAPSF
ncbi:MAG: hypothetical protein VKJ04_07225 [Vampirovibrionales bacterium]|nr:hypothetical protein [Vampirovibrionales bacterium]